MDSHDLVTWDRFDDCPEGDPWLAKII